MIGSSICQAACASGSLPSPDILGAMTKRLRVLCRFSAWSPSLAREEEESLNHDTCKCNHRCLWASRDGSQAQPCPSQGQQGSEGPSLLPGAAKGLCRGIARLPAAYNHGCMHHATRLSIPAHLNEWRKRDDWVGRCAQQCTDCLCNSEVELTWMSGARGMSLGHKRAQMRSQGAVDSRASQAARVSAVHCGLHTPGPVNRKDMKQKTKRRRRGRRGVRARGRGRGRGERGKRREGGEKRRRKITTLTTSATDETSSSSSELAALIILTAP